MIVTDAISDLTDNSNGNIPRTSRKEDSLDRVQRAGLDLNDALQVQTKDEKFVFQSYNNSRAQRSSSSKLQLSTKEQRRLITGVNGVGVFCPSRSSGEQEGEKLESTLELDIPSTEKGMR